MIENDLRRWMTVARMLCEAQVPADLLAPHYFHGTRKQYVKSILAHGLYPPDFVAFGTTNSALRPVAGRVYMTPNARDAAQYGKYLAVINRETLLDADLQPDEDEVGEIYHWVMQKDFSNLDRTREVHKDSPGFVARMELLNSPEQQKGLYAFKSFMNAALTPKMKHEVVVNGLYDWWAKAGKRALKTMPPNIVRWLISIGVHVGVAGPVLPDAVWMIERSELLPDGSNLPEVATRLDYDKAATTPMPPKGPPQKWKATFRFISNYPVFGSRLGIPKPDNLPEPKYKTREKIFTAPSEEEARAEAEIHMEHTAPSADYQLISFERIE